MNQDKIYFGTDGIRGKVNLNNLTPEIFVKAGQAAGIKFTKGNHRHSVIIGKDTRLSGYMIENALTSGFLSVGMDVILAGPVPTPAVAMLTKSMRADLGVMISGSHNLYCDNGIKFFNPQGYKLSDIDEHEIEKLMQSNLSKYLVTDDKIGRAKRMDDVVGRYIENIKSTFPKGKSLKGLKVVIDSANGACYKIAPRILWELGAEVITIGNNPNGLNINDKCGSTDTKLLASTVIEHNADIGIALDGDGDRVGIIDNEGAFVDGDQIIALIAKYWHEKGKLINNQIVTTKMSNLGLEHYLEKIGLSMARTEIGDRYVMELMKKNSCNIGGEKSGHIIVGDYATTGDGLVATLQILALMIEKAEKSSVIFKECKLYPQILCDIKYRGNLSLDNKEIQNKIKEISEELGDEGRVLVRKSGTEAVIRVMVEGKDAHQIKRMAKEIVKVIRKHSLFYNKTRNLKNVIAYSMKFLTSKKHNIE